jgi:hypothetical protein
VGCKVRKRCYKVDRGSKAVRYPDYTLFKLKFGPQTSPRCPVPMESFERLELSFLLLPRMEISTSIIAPDGTKIVQSSFEGHDCPIEWVAALSAMAAAAKNAHFADCLATNSPSPSTLNPSRDAFLSRRSSVSHSDRRRRAPATKASHKNSNNPQTTWPCPEDIYNHLPHFPDELDEHVTHLLPSDPVSPSGVNANRVSSPAHVIESGRQSPVDVTSQSTSKSIEQSLTSPNIAGDTEVNSTLIDSSDTTSSPRSMVKRTQKLKAQLQAIKDGYIPDKDEFNDTVRQLYQHSSASSQPVTSMEQLGRILGRLGNISSAVGIIYSLLSWEIFRWEEDRLVRDEGQALLVAAKQVR